MAPRRAAEPKPITGVALLVAVAVAGYAIWNDYPGIAALWAGLLVAAWTHPPAVFTGKKDARGYATPGDPGEQAAMSRYRYWADLKTRLIVPGADWLPGFKVQGSWIVAVLAGFAAYWIPVHDKYTTVYGPWVDAAAAFLCVAVPAGAARRNTVPDDTSPGTTVDALIALARKEPGKVAGLAAAGLGLGAVVGTVLAVFVPAVLALAHRPGIPEAAIWTVSLVGGPLATLWKAWSREALEHWRLVVDAREEWNPRWAMLKQDPAPRLVDRRTVGSATVDTFDAPASAGSMTYLPMAAKITPTLGAGSRVAVLDVPNLDSKGQPVPGSRHPLRFEIADWPADQVPDLTDPATTKDEAELLARCAIAWFTEQLGCGRIILDDIALLTAPPATATAEGAEAEEVPEWAQESPSPAVWGMTWHAPQGPDAGYIRSIAGDMAGAFNAPVLVDHRGNNGAGVAYIGAYDPQYGPEWAPGAGVTDDAIQSLMDDAAWDSRWSDVMKQGANPPVRQGATAKTEALKDGTQINAVSFVTRLGMPPADFFPLEGKLPTVLNAAPFVAMTYFPAQGGGRAGERHAQAFTVLWADRPVPSKPEQVAPVPGSEGPKWALTAQVNQMFAAARLARPEVVRATALTRAESRQHIWKLDLRLYEGVTLAEVRGMAEKMRQNRGSEWLRVAQAPEGCVIYMGARPSRVKLARPDTALELERLDWQQILLDSGLAGLAGRMPVLKKVDHLPRNEQVKVLDFDLTGTGLEFTAFTGVRGKLEANSGNAWVQPRRVKNSSTDIQLLVCEVDPMPEKAGYDWAEIASSDVIPFATGVDGEPIAFNHSKDPHALVVGGTGSGKSVTLQSLAFGAIMRGYEVYVIDPTKGGADFRFAEPYARGFTGDIKEAAAMMKALYAEVVRRKNTNTVHAVGKYSDLPEHIRPAHVFIFLDEFTSLMGQDHVPPASDDPEMDEEREQIIALNRARTEIGIYTGKIAREARSAGFTLILATQKLSAKTLDTIPGGNDLKDLTLDTRIPVPVSDRFPDGWAFNGDLEVGDKIFTPSGEVAPIAAFSDVFAANDVYALTFDDGQVVKAGGGHLWKASNAASRKWWSRVARNSDGDPKLIAAAERSRAAAATLPVGTYCDVQALIELSGYGSPATVHRLASKFGLDRHLSLGTGWTPVDPARRRGKPANGYVVDDALVKVLPRNGLDYARAEAHRGHTMTTRDIAEAFYPQRQMGRLASNIGTILRVKGVTGVEREHAPVHYDGAEYLQALASHLEALAFVDESGAPSLEMVVTTEQMKAAIDAGGRAEWAVELPTAFDLPEVDLPVAPYVLGVWLGDGSKGSGIIASSAAPSCTGPDGATDQQHMLAELAAAGYEPAVLKCSDKLIGTRGLKADLRAAGVLDRKHIPASYLRASHAQRLALLQGLMDTDGTLDTRGRCCILQTSEELAFGILELVRSLGFKGTLSTWPASYKVAGTDEVRVTGTAHGISFMAAEPAFRLRRKLDKQAHPMPGSSSARRYIRSIEKLDSVPTRCIAVDHPEHLFLVEGFIPTHNTNLSRLLMGKATSGERMSALRDPMEAPPLGDAIPPGRGLFESTAGAAMAIQAWYDPAEQGALAAKLSEAQIPVLSEDEKLSTAAPVKTSARRAPETVELPELTLDAADLDLGELELTLDDLDDVDGTDDGGAGTPVPDVPGEEPAGQEPEPVVGTAVLFDVDGVIAPFTAADGMARIAAPGHGTVFYDPAIVDRLAALDAHQAWLTNWDTDAPEAFGHLLPRAVRVLPYGSEETGWWKIDALLAFAAENPGLRRVAWIDDELAEVDPLLGVSFAEIAADALADAGLECLLLAPDPHAGATGRDVERLEAFVAGLPDPGPADPAAGPAHWLSALDAEDETAAPADDAAATPDDDAHDARARSAAPAAAVAVERAAEDEFAPEPKPFVAPPAYDGEDEFEVEPKRARVPVPAYTEDDPFA